MPRLAADGLEMDWSPAQRLLTFVHGPGCVCSGENAHRFSAAMREWVGDEPFVVLVDAAGAEAITREWRSVWARAFSDHKERSRVGIYHATTAGRLVISLWSFVSGVEVRFFADEAQARAWLGVSPSDASPATRPGAS